MLQDRGLGERVSRRQNLLKVLSPIPVRATPVHHLPLTKPSASSVRGGELVQESREQDGSRALPEQDWRMLQPLLLAQPTLASVHAADLNSRQILNNPAREIQR